MKINQYGTVTISQDKPIDVSGWLVERESSDPVDATNEQLLLEVVLTWAREKFRLSANQAVADVAALRQKAAKVDA